MQRIRRGFVPAVIACTLVILWAVSFRFPLIALSWRVPGLDSGYTAHGIPEYYGLERAGIWDGMFGTFYADDADETHPVALSAISILWGVALCSAASFLRILAPRPRRIGHCESCAYELTGIDSSKCPECGSYIPFIHRRHE